MKQSLDNLGATNPYSVAIKTKGDPEGLEPQKHTEVFVEITAPANSFLINGIYLEWRAFKLNDEPKSEPVPSAGIVKFNAETCDNGNLKYSVTVNFDFKKGVCYYCNTELYHILINGNDDPRLRPDKGAFINFED